MIDRRKLLGLGAFAGAAAPFARAFAAPAVTGAALIAPTADEAFLRLVHPDLRAAAALLLYGERPGAAATVAALRREPPPVPPRADVPVMQRTIPGAPGQPEVAVVVVNARAEAVRAAILHLHGGGFVAGSAAQELADLQDICAALDCVAVSVDYRLAPETRWSGSTGDTYAALKWLYAHAFELGAHPDRIAVMGENAGGAHAALLAITARDRGEVSLAFQCLTGGLLDDRTVARKFRPHVGRVAWTAPENRLGWASFLDTQPGGAAVPAAAVPARQADLAGLPPAFIGVGALDLLFDEGADYAQRLTVAGVAAELVAVPGAFHGFERIAPQAPVAAAFRAARLDALRRGTAPVRREPSGGEPD